MGVKGLSSIITPMGLWWVQPSRCWVLRSVPELRLIEAVPWAVPARPTWGMHLSAVLSAFWCLVLIMRCPCSIGQQLLQGSTHPKGETEAGVCCGAGTPPGTEGCRCGCEHSLTHSPVSMKDAKQALGRLLLPCGHPAQGAEHVCNQLLSAAFNLSQASAGSSWGRQEAKPSLQLG